MQNQNQQQDLQNSTQMPPQQNHGGHELFDAHEAIGALMGNLEHYVVYEQHIKDQALMDILQRHRTFTSQLYNTTVDVLQTGQDPSVPTQTYQMQANNDVLYGLKPSTPKTPITSVNELNDECISGFMIGMLKSTASAFMLAALESTNPVIRRVFSDSIPNIIEMAYEVFLYQNENQYYQVPQLDQQDMQTLINSYGPIQGTTH